MGQFTPKKTFSGEDVYIFQHSTINVNVIYSLKRYILPAAIFAVRKHSVSTDWKPGWAVPGYYSERGVRFKFLYPVFPRFCLANYPCFSLVGAGPNTSVSKCSANFLQLKLSKRVLDKWSSCRPVGSVTMGLLGLDKWNRLMNCLEIIFSTYHPDMCV